MVIFSQGYAFSRWCLDELVKIMEQREQRGHMVYPIFFHVDPSDFRHQRNYVEEAFKEHEGKYDNEKTQSWRLALEQVTGISGWPLKDQHESVFVEDIVTEISKKFDADVLDEQEVIKMKQTYRRIQAMLRDAENKVYMKEGEAVKVWFEELKHMAYDIEDVLDELNTAFLKSKIERDQAQITLPSSSLSSKVQNTSSTISWFGEIALRIKELNQKLEATTVKDYFPLTVDPNSYNDPRLEPQEKKPRLERSKTTSLINESVVYGRDHDKLALIERLLLSDKNRGGSGNDIPIIAIVGMGGLGKTTLAQLAFNNDEMKKHFPQRIWVCVSDPFDEVRIAKAILESLKRSPSSFNELENLLQEIHQNVEGKKFLLVLDDVWTEDENKWEPLKLSLSSAFQESRILVTTRKEKVSTILGCTNPFLLEVLSETDSWTFFSKIAFFGRDKEDCENLTSIGRRLVKKCAGLPLAIKTLASLLRFKGTNEQWQRILDSEMWKLEDQIFEKLYAPLLLSYYDLQMPVKQCFRYCAIFPKDHRIKRDELVKLWMAQGFFGETHEGNDLEMMGEEIFDNLAIRGFFQEFEKDKIDGNITECKMHDIVHDFAKFLTQSECLLVVDDGTERQRQVLSSHENVRHLTLIPRGKCKHHVSIINGIDKFRSFLVPFSCIDDVQNFLFFDENSFYLAQNLDASSDFCLDDVQNVDASFDKLISLRMLSCYNLYHTKTLYPRQWIIPGGIGKLIHLRYLSLEGIEGLFEIPVTLYDLCNLQTLNLRRCLNIRALPRGMEKLINLRHFLNKGTNIIIPRGMEKLTSLQTLEAFEVPSSLGSFSLADLGKLIHLQGNLRISWLGIVRKAGEAREAGLSTKAGLRSLTLDFSVGYAKDQQRTREDDALLLQALQPPQQLQVLRIYRCRSLEFPDWMTSLTLLRNVELYECYNWSSLPPMGKLPLLEFLTIDSLKKVKEVREEFLGTEARGKQASSTSSSSSSSSSVNHIDVPFFPNLKELKFHAMYGWEEWEYEYEKQLLLRSRGVGEGHHSSSSSSSNAFPIIMPKLQLLYIDMCPKLKMLPRHLLQSRALQQLTIRGSPFLFERFNKDKPSISHIPEVIISKSI